MQHRAIVQKGGAAAIKEADRLSVLNLQSLSKWEKRIQQEINNGNGKLRPTSVGPSVGTRKHKSI